MADKQRPSGTMAGSARRLAVRFYHLNTGHSLTGQYLQRTKNQTTAKSGGARVRTRRESTCSSVVCNGSGSRRSCGQR